MLEKITQNSLQVSQRRIFTGILLGNLAALIVVPVVSLGELLAMMVVPFSVNTPVEFLGTLFTGSVIACLSGLIAGYVSRSKWLFLGLAANLFTIWLSVDTLIQQLSSGGDIPGDAALQQQAVFVDIASFVLILLFGLIGARSGYRIWKKIEAR